MAKQSRTIAFRLHDALEARLATEASERKVSVGEHVRQIVINHLSGDTHKLSESVSAADERLGRMERQLRIIAVELLINAGHAEPAEAQAWARATLDPIEPSAGGTN